MKKTNGRNRRIQQISVIFLILMGAMTVYFFWYTAFQARQDANNPYNARWKKKEKEMIRGEILTADGAVLAESSSKAGKRTYPYGPLFANVVGQSLKKTTGIEARMNEELLTSSVPWKEKLKDLADGIKEEGNRVVTSLSLPLQQKASELIGDRRGAAVVMEVKTGRILAMVSKPSYDPNRFLEDFKALNDPNRTDAPLLNRVTQGLYVPGSTFKILTALEYIREKGAKAYEFHYHCPGYIMIGNYRLSCYGGEAHGDLDFAGALAESCNGAFATMGLSMDRARYQSTINSFFFNRTFPSDLPVRKSTAVLPDSKDRQLFAQTAIGQGKTLETPLLNVMITASVANGGHLMRPRLYDRIETNHGKTVKTFKPEILATPMTEKEAKAVGDLMRGTVAHGTAGRAESPLAPVAGKTGSAQYSATDPKLMHAWFTGFAPYGNPEIAVTVILEGAGSGGENAAPVVRDIVTRYMELKKEGKI